MLEQFNDTENPLDKFIRINDISEATASTDAIKRRRFVHDYPVDAFPKDAYDALRGYVQFKRDGNDDAASPYARTFKKKMGFSIESLENRAEELEEQANKR